MIAQNNRLFMLFKKVIVRPSEKYSIWGPKMAKCDFWPKIQDGRLQRAGGSWNRFAKIFFCHDACQWSILSDFKWDRAIFKQNGFYWAPLITVHDIEVITRDKNSWLLTKYDDTKLLIVKSNDIEKSFSWSKWKAKGCVVLYFYSHSMICQF